MSASDRPVRPAHRAFPELEAFQAQDWERPTRCPPLTVRELVTHVGAIFPIWASFFEGDEPTQASTDRVQWWRYDVAANAPRIVERAQRMAGERPDDEIVPWFRGSAKTVLDAFGAAPADRLVARSGVSLTAADLVSVGVVEVGIHTMDLGHATLRGERLHAEAVPIVVAVLDGLLGATLPRSIGWDAKTYILTATERRPLSSIEQHTLGSLADRFPLLT